MRGDMSVRLRSECQWNSGKIIQDRAKENRGRFPEVEWLVVSSFARRRGGRMIMEKRFTDEDMGGMLMKQYFDHQRSLDRYLGWFRKRPLPIAVSMSFGLTKMEPCVSHLEPSSWTLSIQFQRDNPRLSQVPDAGGQAQAKGIDRWGAKAIWEVLRYEMALKSVTTGEKYALNNNRSRFARKLMEEERRICWLL